MNKVNFRSEDVLAACHAAVALTNPEDESIRVPMRHAAGCLVLREIMLRVMSGEYRIVEVASPQPETPPDPPPNPE